MHLARTQDPVFFRASQKAAAGEALTEEERWHYGQFFLAILRHFEELHYQRELKLVDDTTWAANLGGMKTFVSPSLAGEILSQNSHMYRQSFVELLYQIRE